jgi:hypothetical protein
MKPASRASRHKQASDRPHRRRCFRGRKTTASLKARRDTSGHAHFQRFPWSKDHGFVEGRCRSGRRTPHVQFPWSKDHGFVEGARRGRPSGPPAGFPWSKDHGFVEGPPRSGRWPPTGRRFRGRKTTASLKGLVVCHDHSPVRSFRGRKATASLKAQSRKAHVRNDAEFPWSKDHGFVQAKGGNQVPQSRMRPPSVVAYNYVAPTRVGMDRPARSRWRVSGSSPHTRGNESLCPCGEGGDTQ